MLLLYSILIMVLFLITNFIYQVFNLNSISTPFNSSHQKLIMVFVSLLLIWEIQILLLIHYFQDFPSNLFYLGIVSSVSPFFATGVLILFGKIIEMFVIPKTSKLLIAMLSSLFSIHLLLAVIKVYLTITTQGLLFNQIFQFSFVILFLATLLIIGHSINMMRRYKQNSSTNKQRLQLNLMRYGLIVFIFLIPVTFLIFTINYYLGIIQILLSAMVTYFIVKSFLVNPTITFVYPDKPIIILLLDESGTVRFLRSFVKQRSEGQITVLSSYINVFNGFISEVYQDFGDNDTQEITSIEFKDDKILFETISDLGLTLILFTPIENTYIRSSMHSVVNWIKNIDTNQMKDRIKRPEYIELDTIVDESFYYLNNSIL